MELYWLLNASSISVKTLSVQLQWTQPMVLRRGMEVVATGVPITMPIGEQIKGRLMNVTGEAIDGIGPLDKKGGYPIHRKPPKYEDLSTEKEVLYTGIKVIDLIEPYSKGGKIGLFGGAGVGKTVVILELINNIAKVIFRTFGICRCWRKNKGRK